MRSLILLLAVFAYCTLSGIVSAEQAEQYNNYKVYNVHINTEDQLKHFDSLKDKYSVHVLRQGAPFVLPFYLTIEPQYQASFEKQLTNFNIDFELINDDLQKILDGRTLADDTLRTDVELEWTKYHLPKTIYSWIHKVARENYFIKKYIIGFTVNLRPIYALKISKNRNRKAIFIESNIHAIEWISSAVSTCFLDKLLTTHSNLIEDYDWIFVPVLNPDGFHHTHYVEKLWRKNRSWSGHFNSSGLCFGTDMNRNFNHHWRESGYNVREPCDHFYGGNNPESEFEIRALLRFVNSFPKGYIRMYLALHSYGQLVLLPYGHALNVYPANYADMLQISEGFATAAENRHGVNYLYGTSGELLGIVSGAAKDYFYDFGIPYSATIELRDRGRYGFFLPADQIIPTCEEFTDGVVAMLDAAEDVNLFD